MLYVSHTGIMTRFTWIALLVLFLGCREQGKTQRLLRVCADPNNLPFSNQQRAGFENSIESS